jgi:hypothetical protein
VTKKKGPPAPAQVPAVRFRDRVREIRRVPASSLKPHPKNWRRHSDDQRKAFVTLLERSSPSLPASLLPADRGGRGA